MSARFLFTKIVEKFLKPQKHSHHLIKVSSHIRGFAYLIIYPNPRSKTSYFVKKFWVNAYSKMGNIPIREYINIQNFYERRGGAKGITFRIRAPRIIISKMHSENRFRKTLQARCWARMMK